VLPARFVDFGEVVEAVAAVGISSRRGGRTESLGNEHAVASDESKNKNDNEQRTKAGTANTTGHVSKTSGRDLEGSSHPISAQYIMPMRLLSWMQTGAGGYIRATSSGDGAGGTHSPRKTSSAGLAPLLEKSFGALPIRHFEALGVTIPCVLPIHFQYSITSRRVCENHQTTNSACRHHIVRIVDSAGVRTGRWRHV